MRNGHNPELSVCSDEYRCSITPAALALQGLRNAKGVEPNSGCRVLLDVWFLNLVWREYPGLYPTAEKFNPIDLY